MFVGRGLAPAVFVLNTCTVVDTTEKRMIKRMNDLRAQGKEVIVTGCMAKVQGNRISIRLPDSMIIPPDEYDLFTGKVESKYGCGSCTDSFEYGNTAIIPIAQGCLGRCAYCITKFARGKLISRTEDDILNEFKARSTSGEGFSTYMYNVTKESFYKAWRPENGSNTYSRLRNSLNVQQPVSSFYVENGSYLKLKTLSLAYNLPSAVCKAIRFTGLKLSFTVDNVWCWTKYSGLDPDISSSNATFQGVDRMGYPTGRTFTFGLVANF